MIWDISRIYERRQDKRTTRKDFIETATQRFFEALFGSGLAIGGSIGGAALGGAVGGF
ncbi:hypothetical protein DPMN_109245 [Dreissena polymorpha]|uniref:Uncharacterized protein n=1 Tax=Dreissena polymorpha TaxID=45954 RepID=A0A9D4QMR6_DREPO|nr:hypothetical protein DPMN_109245 [Dreissena polymorpha]